MNNFKGKKDNVWCPSCGTGWKHTKHTNEHAQKFHVWAFPSPTAYASLKVPSLNCSRMEKKCCHFNLDFFNLPQFNLQVWKNKTKHIVLFPTWSRVLSPSNDVLALAWNWNLFYLHALNRRRILFFFLDIFAMDQDKSKYLKVCLKT